MESFLTSRPSIAKLGVPAKTTVNLFTSLAKRASPPSGALPDPAPAAGEPAAHGHDTRVELVRENGVVTRIVVLCKCGERIELDCAY